MCIPEALVRFICSQIFKISLEAMAHPRCVGLGEIGLDYHYSLSPHPIQQEVFARQLRIAVALNKPLTIHTREAEEDTERILKEEVPKDWKVNFFITSLCQEERWNDRGFSADSHTLLHGFSRVRSEIVRSLSEFTYWHNWYVS